MLDKPPPKDRILSQLFSMLANRGWKLGKNIQDEDASVVLERLIQLCCTDRPSGSAHHFQDNQVLRPLPDWFLDTFRDEFEKLETQSALDLVSSYLNHSEIVYDIQDSAALWLDFDTCSKNDHEGLHSTFKTRQIELRDNNFYKFLVQQPFVFKQDNTPLGRSSISEKLSLRQRLQFLGTFSLENFATNHVRDAVLKHLIGKYKTDAIPNTFIDFFESVRKKPIFAKIIIVSGYFTLFFSVQDYLAGLRLTTIDREQLHVLERSSEDQLVDHFRDSFIQGISILAPTTTHYRFDKIEHKNFLDKVALRFWQHKLRDEMLRLEKLRPKERVSSWSAPETGQKVKQTHDYLSSLVFGRIVPGTTGSLDFMEPRNKGCFSITCRALCIKDPHFVLAVDNDDLEHCQAVSGDLSIFRFPIKTSTVELKYYACQCEIQHIKQISENETAFVAIPNGSVISLERRHPRVASNIVPVHNVNGWVGLIDYPNNIAEHKELGAPHFHCPNATQSVFLKDISAGGISLEVKSDACRKIIQDSADFFGLLQIQMNLANQGSKDVLLAFRFRSLRRDSSAFHCGLQFQAEADHSLSGKYQWRDISIQGCQELNMLIFSALLKQR